MRSENSSESLATEQTPEATESYDVHVTRIGGRNKDGSPSYIGPWTFECDQVRRVVEKALTGRVLNACAGKTKLRHSDEVVRNDINPDRDADHHVDVGEIDGLFDPDTFDTVVFDPPFDQSQADEHYESMHARDLVPARKKLIELVRPGGRFVELGWNLQAANEQRGWSREELHIFDRGPTLQPVFLTVDRNYQRRLTDGGFRD